MFHEKRKRKYSLSRQPRFSLRSDNVTLRTSCISQQRYIITKNAPEGNYVPSCIVSNKMNNPTHYQGVLNLLSEVTLDFFAWWDGTAQRKRLRFTPSRPGLILGAA